MSELHSKFTTSYHRRTFSKSEAYFILGVAFQLLGENESARQAFMHSI